MPVSAEDLSGGVNDSEASALFYWLRAVAETDLWWFCRPKDGGQGVILETVTKKECPEAHVSPKDAIRARMKAVGLGPWPGV